MGVAPGVYVTNLADGGAFMAETSKQPIRTRHLGHVTGYQPIRDQYFLVRSVIHNSITVGPRFTGMLGGKGFCPVNRGSGKSGPGKSGSDYAIRPKQVNSQSELVI
eukprot:sb/3477792/